MPCGNVFRYDVTVPGSNLAEPMYFFPFLLFSFIFYISYQYNNCLSRKR